jgi:hypothetical protein
VAHVRALSVGAAVALTLVPVSLNAQSTAVCSVASGEAVVLRSSDFDPDVLVWDARQRAIDYGSGNLHGASDVLSHTFLSRPGTRAVVIQCAPATVRPKYTDEILDAVGVKIVTGPQRGRYGWVTSDDLRFERGREAAEVH